MSDNRVHAQVREIASALGLPFILRPNETIRKSVISPDSITVVIDFIVTNETAREVRYVRAGTRLSQWVADDGDDTDPNFTSVGGWKYQSVVMWDDTFKPYTEVKIGRIETPAEYAERRRWEGEQYRVGSSRTPMDSAYRVTLGHTTDAMTNYWNK